MRNRRIKRDLLRLELEQARISENCLRYLRTLWITSPNWRLILGINWTFFTAAYHSNMRLRDK